WSVRKRTAITGPEIAVAILAKSVRLHEHSVSERLQKVARTIEVNNRRLGPVVQPDPALAVRHEADRRTGLDLTKMGPVFDHLIWVRHGALSIREPRNHDGHSDRGWRLLHFCAALIAGLT